jgi:hypothetical protein
VTIKVGCADSSTIYKVSELPLSDIARYEVGIVDLDYCRAIQEVVAASAKAWSLWCGDDLIAIVGVRTASFVSKEASLWFVATSLLPLHKTTFLRASRSLLQQVTTTYPILYCDVLNKFSGSVKWLKWLGFKELTPRPVSKFRNFILRRPV